MTSLSRTSRSRPSFSGFASSLRRAAATAVDRRIVPGAPPRTHAVEVRRDLEVTMTDGVTLVGDLHLPVDHRPDAPTVLIRSPYGRRGPIATMNGGALAARGLPTFMQSCRGTAGSGGTFEPQVHEQADGVDTIRWLREQPWFTGRLVTFGASYLGYVQWAVAGHLERTAPELAPDALCLFVTMGDFGSITWDEGAFALRNALGWSSMMAYAGAPLGMLRGAIGSRRAEAAFDAMPLSAGDTAAIGRPIPWYQTWVANESLDEPYWVGQNHTPTVADVTAPVLMVTGWYDIFLPWQLADHQRLVLAGNAPQLTIGPWGHADPALAGRCIAETLDFVGERFLGEPSVRRTPVRIFVTGAEEWRDLDAWPPPADVTDLYLWPDGGLAGDIPPADTPPSAYRYDPADPTPAVGGPVVGATGDRTASNPLDNTAHESRADVLVFTGDVLDAPLEVVGEPSATVHVRSDRPSFDVFVRICDVYPDGRSMTVCDGIRRVGSAGTAGRDPEPADDGSMAVTVRLWPIAHRFRVGHRVRVQVSSGAHPRYARNPGSGASAASARELLAADQEVFHDPVHRSRVHLPVVG